MDAVTLSADCSKIEADFQEVAQKVKSLENLLGLVRGKLQGLGTDDSLVGVGKTTLDAGNLVCCLEITSRDFELIRSALGALELDLAHNILSGD